MPGIINEKKSLYPGTFNPYILPDTNRGDSMSEYRKPAHWADPKNKLFPYQVGFTCPPHDFDAAPSDFLRIAPETVGVHAGGSALKVYASIVKS